MGLVITFVLGIFVLGGAAIAGFARDEGRIRELSVAVALGAIVSLLALDLLPEAAEGAEAVGWPATIAAACVGFALLAVLERFLPDEHGGSSETHSHGSALRVSISTTIALTVHNIIEGMSVYSAATESLALAVMLGFGIGVHNIPMGMIVYSGVRGEPVRRRAVVLGMASLSTFAGGLIMRAVHAAVSLQVVSVMIALTVGLLLYIVLCELIPHVRHASDKRLVAVGIIVGAALVALGVFVEGLA